MLKIVVSGIEQYDEVNDEFIKSKPQALQLEHSLVSLSKWESKWCKPFLLKDKKTYEESIDYIRCMTLTQNVESEVYTRFSQENLNQVYNYIEAPMTATIISKQKGSPNREIITAEIVYYWMITLNIPFECQKWHLNRLLTLINVCNIKNKPPEKMNGRQLMNRNSALNAARRKAANSKG